MDAKPSLPYPPPTPPSRARSHRKRLSITRLSSESTPALPVYLRTEDLPDDRPPDYPESAHEADDDTDTSAPDTLLPLSSPRPRRGFSHRRRHSASPVTSPSGDPYLDSLLARSVHALEMSNALLQSSISTHTSLSAVLAVDSPVTDSSLEARARDLTSRIRVNSKVHANWMDDLAAISEHITTDSPPPDALGLSLAHEDPISRSLPTDPSPVRLRAPHHRNHSSSDLHQIKADSVDSVEPHLRLSNWCRSRLISPAPRALTQYVESNADPDAIYLPSTLGLRSTSSAHFPPGVSSPPPPLAPTVSPPPHSAGHEPSTAAYTLLSSFLARRSSTSSAGSHVSSRSYPERLVKATADTATNSSRTSSTVVPSRTLTPHSSPSRSRIGKRSLSLPPVPPPLVLTNRPLTPPPEDPSLSSLSSASSSNTSSDPHPNPVLSLQALRKILDDQPRPSTSSHAPPEGRAPRRPSFHPRTPLPAPTIGTSTATASVSRLFTKPVHMHSGSSSREPRQSALKGGLRTPQSPASSNGGLLAPGQNTGPGGSSASSARSTPKRISFAELPEPYGSERGGGSGRGFEKKRSRKAKKRSGKGKGKSKGDDADAGSDGDDDDDDKGWWAKLLLGTGSARSLSLGRREERVESRIARGLGSRGGFGGGIEDWAV
ncbi:hypothetical protein EDB87DRAFT_1612812 [Lactarius vividus]|nr:hypothetical protein EDB87DRAFT_1612812 [Lactarius vividus]